KRREWALIVWDGIGKPRRRALRIALRPQWPPTERFTAASLLAVGRPKMRVTIRRVIRSTLTSLIAATSLRSQRRRRRMRPRPPPLRIDGCFLGALAMLATLEG